MEWKLTHRCGSWITSAALLMGSCVDILSAATPAVTSRRPTPTTLPSGWFSNAGEIQLVADHTAAPSSSSRRNAAERLEMIRKSVIVDGDSVPADVVPPPSTSTAVESADAVQLRKAGEREAARGMEAFRSVMGKSQSEGEKSQQTQAQQNARATSRSVMGPTAALTPPQNVTASNAPAVGRRSNLAEESMEDISEPPIVDRGTSHGTDAGRQPVPRNNPVRSSVDAAAGSASDGFVAEEITDEPPVQEPTVREMGDLTGSSEAPSGLSPHPAGAADERAQAQGGEGHEDGRSDPLFSSEIPALSFVTHGPRSIVVGKPASYVVRMSNGSGATAENVDVKVQVPAWADILKTSVSSGAAHQEPTDDDKSIIRWQLDRMDAQHSETLEITLVPRSSQPFELGVGWTVAPTHGLTQIEVQEPRLDLTVTGPRDVLFGEKKVYTLTISNPGTGDAENVTLQLMPIVPSDRSGAIRKVGTLRPGSREIIELELTARQAGALEVKAVAAADGDLQVTAAQEVFVRRANLQVALEGPDKKYAGTPSRYILRVENTGDAPASEVMASVRLPSGARDVSASRGGQWDASQNLVRFPVGSMQAGETKELHIQCDLLSPGENRLEARANGAGDLAATHSLVTSVEAVADLKLTVNDPKGVVPVGTDAVYEVRIVNRGTRAAEQIQLVGYFSEGIEPVAVEGWRGEIEDGQVVLQPIRRLQAGQEMVIRITARASTEANHVFRAELECADPETRLATEEWTRYFGRITDQPDGIDRSGIATDAQHKMEPRVRR